LLNKFLGDTETNLHDTAHALEIAVNRYASTDSACATELDRLRKVNGEPAPGR